MVGVPDLLPRASELLELACSVVTLSEAHLGVEDIEEAARWAKEARSYVAFNATWAEAVDRLDSQIALAKHEPEQALSLIAPWLESPGPMPLEQAWMNELAAQAHLELQHRDKAMEHARGALALYQTLGARPRADRVSRWIEVHTPKPKGRPRTASPGELTEREHEIISLIADGKTNREIVDALTISAGTKKHVENIKAKLGVKRRTELAAHEARVFRLSAFRATTP